MSESGESGESRLWVARHPAVQPFRGAVGDLELPLLRPAAALAEELLPRLRGLAVTTVVTSPRARAADVARLLAAHLAVPLRIEPRLREIEHGLWTGRTWDELESWDHQRYRYWLEHWIDVAPPGGESAIMLAQRVRAALLDEAAAPPGALWLTHRGVVQALRVLGGAPWPQAAATPVPYLDQPGALVELRPDASARWRLAPRDDARAR